MEDDTTPAPESPRKKGKKQAPRITKKTAVVGAAIGIGSAAIAAALLYANRSDKKS